MREQARCDPVRICQAVIARDLLGCVWVGRIDLDDTDVIDHLRPNSFSMSPWASFTKVGAQNNAW